MRTITERQQEIKVQLGHIQFPGYLEIIRHRTGWNERISRYIVIISKTKKKKKKKKKEKKKEEEESRRRRRRRRGRRNR